MAANPMVAGYFQESVALIAELRRKGIDVVSSGWVNNDETERWSFFVSSSRVDSDGPLASYKLVQDSLKSIGAVNLVASDVTMVGKNRPIFANYAGEPWAAGRVFANPPYSISSIQATTAQNDQPIIRQAPIGSAITGGGN